MPGITQLSNNITASIRGAEALLGIGPPIRLTSQYPGKFNNNQNANRLNEQNWNKLPQAYTFSVVNENGTPVDGWTDFALPLAPQSINQSEQFAHNIVPTQGGTVVTHSGNRYKSLTISGTTGIAPFRGAGGVASTGDANFAPTNLATSSGYEVFIRLRNYFKAYYEFKNNGELDNKVRLLWKNYKDGEFLIVELNAFNMKRAAGRPFLYDYDIDMRVLGSFRFTPPTPAFLTDFERKIQNALDKINTARGVMLGLQDTLRQVEAIYDSTVLEPLRSIGLALKAFIGTALVLGDVGTRIINNTLTLGGIGAILGSLSEERATALRLGGGSEALLAANIPTDINNAVAASGTELINNLNELLLEVDIAIAPEETRDALNEEIENLNLPLQFYQETIDELLRVQQNLEDFVNLGSDNYDTLFGRTSTVSVEEGKNVTNDEFDLLAGFNQAISGIQDVITVSTLFRSSYDDEIQSLLAAFDGDLDLQTTTAVREITLPADTDLERIALTYLGDSIRWPEIVVLNGLTAPYITQRPRFISLDGITDTDLLTSEQLAMFNFDSTVASPGDTITVPAPAIFGFGETPSGAENALTEGLSQVEKNLGVDLRVSDDFDLILTSSGDIDAVASAGNMAQAVILRLMYEKGDLLRNPELGVGLQVGSKIPALEVIRDDIIRSLTQDPRVESLEDFTIARNGPEINLRFLLRIKQVDQPVPIELTL